MQLYAIVAIIVAIASVLFALQNNVPVSVGFLTWRFDSSLAMVLLLALALGAIIIALISTPATLKRQWTINRQQKHIRDLEAQLATARSAASGMRDVTPASTGMLIDPSRFVGMSESSPSSLSSQTSPAAPPTAPPDPFTATPKQ